MTPRTCRLDFLPVGDPLTPHEVGDWTGEQITASPAPGVVVTVRWGFVDRVDAKPFLGMRIEPGADPADADEILDAFEAIPAERPGPREVLDALAGLGYTRLPDGGAAQAPTSEPPPHNPPQPRYA